MGRSMPWACALRTHGLDPRGHRAADHLLHLGADAQLEELVGVSIGVDPVAEEDVHHFALWIGPGHGAGEAGVTEAGVAHAIAGGTFTVAGGFVPTETSPVASAVGCAELAFRELLHHGLAQVALATISPAVHQQLH